MEVANHYYTSLHIRPTSVAIVTKKAVPYSGIKHKLTHHENFKSNNTNGDISHAAKRRIQNAIEWMVATSKRKQVTDYETGKTFNFKCNFITLTLSATQRHSDTEVMKCCFQPWLDIVRKKYSLKRYVWRAEVQLNSNIHFHITTDTYIPHQELRRLWNMQQEKLGYITEFFNRHGHHNPNSTDIRSVKHVKKLANYMAKYMSKNRSYVKVGEVRKVGNETKEIMFNSQVYRDENENSKVGKVVASIIEKLPRKVDCKLWFLSRELSKFKSVIITEHDLCFEAFKEAIELHTERTFNHEFVTLKYADWHNLFKAIKGDITKEYNSQITAMQAT